MNYKLIAQKIANILNGLDSEINALSLQNPTDFDFNVQTQGFHLDHIENKKKGINFIPVFLSAMGGSRNPVPDLKQGDYTLPITFFFPVRFKDAMFLLDDYLSDCFCGRRLNYGDKDNPLHCVSNISVAQFGEIQEIDVLKEFTSWVESTYHKEVKVAEPYISMQYTLYLSNADESVIYGNQTSAILTIDKTTTSISPWVANKMYWHADLVYYSNNIYRRHAPGSEATFDSSQWKKLGDALGRIGETVAFASGSLMSNSQTTSEQEIETNKVLSLPLTTAYGSSFTINVKNSDFFIVLFYSWLTGNIQKLRISLSVYINGGEIQGFHRNCFVSSINMPILKGEPLAMTITLNEVAKEN